MVPSTLAENAGLDSTTVISQLMEKYSEDLHCGYGVDIEVGMLGKKGNDVGKWYLQGEERGRADYGYLCN